MPTHDSSPPETTPDTPLAAHHSRWLQAVVDEAAASVAAGGTPIGALVVLDGVELGRGRSEVVPLGDPTAHAEMQAIRAAAAAAGTHQLTDAVVYTSAAPCPMCLAACYWADVAEVVAAAMWDDSTLGGFPDRWMFTELALPNAQRRLKVADPGWQWRRAGYRPYQEYRRRQDGEPSPDLPTS